MRGREGGRIQRGGGFPYQPANLLASKAGRFWNSVQDSEQLLFLSISMTSWQSELAGVRPYWERQA